MFPALSSIFLAILSSPYKLRAASEAIAAEFFSSTAIRAANAFDATLLSSAFG